MKVIRSMVLVSVDPASLERGAEQVFHALLEEIEEFGLSDQIAVSTIQDVGFREDLPLVIVYPDAAVYGPVTVGDVHTIVEEHLTKGNIVPSLLAMVHGPTPEIEWTRGRRGALPVQRRIVLERAGIVDPQSIDDYIVHDGFQALGKAGALELTVEWYRNNEAWWRAIKEKSAEYKQYYAKQYGAR